MKRASRAALMARLRRVMRRATVGPVGQQWDEMSVRGHKLVAVAVLACMEDCLDAGAQDLPLFGQAARFVRKVKQENE